MPCENWSGCSLIGVNFNWTVLYRADLSNAYLMFADLSSAYLTWAKLDNADLSDADLSNANLFCANLSSATLTNANLTETELKNATLESAVGIPLNPENAFWENTTCPDGSNSDDEGNGGTCVGHFLTSPDNKDEDGDGVEDDYDNCPSTPTDEIVDLDSGCSIDQLCPCEGPVNTNTKWKNHGKYVSCVAKSSESFVEMGLISEYDKDVIVSEAAQSDCGSKKKKKKQSQ